MLSNFKRFLNIVPGIVMLLCLGSVYSWSLFRTPLEQLFGSSATQSGLPYLVILFFFALTMPFAGRLIDRYGPKKTALAGSAVFAAAIIVSGFTGSIVHLTLAYGVAGGIGTGLIYGVPLTVAARWFPRKRGLAVGITLLGMGLSSVIVSPVVARLIQGFGVLVTFRLLGLTFLVLLTISSLLIRLPEDSRDDARATADTQAVADLTLGQAIRTRQFLGLWVCYVIGTLTGLMAISITGPLAVEYFNAGVGQAALFLSVFAMFNTLGRPLFGWITDKYGGRNGALLTYVLIILASLLLLFGPPGIVTFGIALALLWLVLGGWLAIAPAATSRYFGLKHYSQNYGVMYTAYGVGALLGVTLSGMVKDFMGYYIYVFYPTIGLAVTGIVVAVWIIEEPAPALAPQTDS